MIYVPIPKQKAFQKVQTRLVRELEKKFSGRHVVFCGDRKILPKPKRGRPDPNKQKRPRSRTLTAVYDNILEDLVFPAEIIGKRIRVKLDGSQLIKVHLDKNQQTTIEHKVSFLKVICVKKDFCRMNYISKIAVIVTMNVGSEKKGCEFVTWLKSCILMSSCYLLIHTQLFNERQTGHTEICLKEQWQSSLAE